MGLPEDDLVMEDEFECACTCFHQYLKKKLFENFKKIEIKFYMYILY